jgi:DNA invertase Pin-like site-specific DNA recombinase
MLHIYTALAQKERALISARTKAALRAAKAQGTVLGNPRLSEAAARARPLEEPRRISLLQICCRWFEKSKKPERAA